MDPETRFRAKLQRRDGHDVWTGARGATGTGLVRIDGKLKTVQRAAWEFSNGPIPPGSRVLSCEVERACARVDHLRLEPSTGLAPGKDTTPPPRRPRGSGSKRQVRPDVWQLVVSDGPGRSGRPRRRTMRVHGSEAAAEEMLDTFAGTAIARSRLGDMRVRELIDRYLRWVDDDIDAEERTQLHRLADDVIEPRVGRHFAALLDGAAVTQLLEHARGDGSIPQELRDLHQLLHGAYRWAGDNGWTSVDPTADVALRDIMRG